jgi:flagellar hook-basal body complex protein FliE
MNTLSAIRPVLQNLPQIQFTPKTGNATPVNDFMPVGETFDTTLRKFVGEVNTKQLAAQDVTKQLLGGQNVPLHQAMIAVEEASVSFQLMVEVRNKLMDSYQELMRMQI